MLLILLGCEAPLTDTHKPVDTAGGVDSVDSGETASETGETGDTAPVDTDGDGWPAEADCDDQDPAVHPGAPEVCNGVDDNCDGAVDTDAVDAPTFYADADADGFGDAPIVLCSQPVGSVTVDGDCDDTDAAVHPGADEVCNERDDDCDGAADEDAVDVLAFYADSDGDGFGGTADIGCTLPDGASLTPQDCDDTDPTVHPAAVETCNARDDDCDGSIDQDAVDAHTWFEDADGDGWFGSPAHGCDPPADSSSTADDCDDADANVNPAATELCNGMDDDCDGRVDLGAEDALLYYVDSDGDGSAGTAGVGCSVPADASLTREDCNDADASISPTTAETCNRRDDDCDGALDEDPVDGDTWWSDEDGDGFGAEPVIACAPAPTLRTNGGDCDDADATVYPGAVERCDDVDEDCDGSIDDSPVDATPQYPDADGDGYGARTRAAPACDLLAGNLYDHSDCDDDDATIHPGAEELCDTADRDCDGSTTDGAVDGDTGYRDDDGDGYGDPATASTFCTYPRGYTPVADDCDDGTSASHPGAPEYCDDEDNDCDGVVDEDPTDCVSFWADADGDGYGTGLPTCLCDGAGLYTATAALDCDDTDAAVRPFGSDACGDGVDADCNGTDACPTLPIEPWTGDISVDLMPTRITSYARFAQAIAVGDWSGDGVPELALGEPLGARVFVEEDVRAGLGLYEMSGRAAIELSGVTDLPGFGSALAMMDPEGDGSVDLVIGADGRGVNSGVVTVFLTSSFSRIDRNLREATLPEQSWTGARLDDALGAAVADAGDLWGTGDPVLACGAPGAQAGGVVYLVATPWPARGDIDSVASARLITTTLDAEFGKVLAGGGDSDGDLLPDLYVGAPMDTSETGAVYLFAGSASLVGDVSTADATASFLGEASPDYAGSAVDASQDVDGDGLDDLVVGAPGNAEAGLDAGKVYLLHAPFSGVLNLADADASWTGEAEGHLAGSAARLLSDLDGDGLADLAAGAPGGGYSYFVYGPTPGAHSLGDADVRFLGEGFEGMDFIDAGAQIVELGDLDGDGRSDVGLAGPTESTSVNMFWMVPGGFHMVTALAADEWVTVPGAVEASGAGAVAGADFDGDGRVELLIGAPGDDSAGREFGALHLVHSGDTEPATSWTGTSLSGGLGYALAAGVDLNADELPDFVVAQPGSTPAEVHVVYGGAIPASGTVESIRAFSWTEEDGSSTTRFGGDLVMSPGVDGAGVVAFTVSDSDHYASGAGTVYRVAASRGGGVIDDVADLIVEGDEKSLGLGDSLAATLDLDGDGIGELAIGVIRDDTTATYAGAVYLYPDSLTGTVTRAEADAVILGRPESDLLGSGLCAPGDVDGDGLADLLVGAAAADGAEPDSGAIWLLRGPVAGTRDVEEDSLRMDGLGDGHYLGQHLAVAGDVNGDGFADFVAASPSGSYGGPGLVTLYYGPDANYTVSRHITTARAPDYWLGTRLAGLGDYDGDGLDEFAFTSSSISDLDVWIFGHGVW